MKATIKGYEITDFDGRPAIKVNIETNEYPITVYLLGPDRRTIDMKVIESEKDIPAILYFGLPGANTKPGTYYLKLEYGAKTLEEKEIELVGSKVQLVDYKFSFEYNELIGYKFKRVELTLKNIGDTPAYVYYIELKVDDKTPLSMVAEQYKTPMNPGETKTYSADFSLLFVDKPGTYKVEIRVADSYGTVIGEFVKTIEVKWDQYSGVSFYFL
ncbi:hypothetical protein [Archaeoglobus profundus]|uniref:CARDB domain-containing protein n=1 Tax=Archaeoglobus profundus (strain DSM 5631 / JCM 9629 / NBRC 100127 / Av18) TaxID=572546 RepID=D2REA9_ARCPA|nr:hypothetical protein [Archaeoglobus profundus]ADB58453.1 hypothetical protein Arcpr_1404 [Archaeoglobus profundus DSM 5631]